jgi:hypothetical protein
VTKSWEPFYHPITENVHKKLYQMNIVVYLKMEDSTEVAPQNWVWKFPTIILFAPIIVYDIMIEPRIHYCQKKKKEPRIHYLSINSLMEDNLVAFFYHNQQNMCSFSFFCIRNVFLMFDVTISVKIYLYCKRIQEILSLCKMFTFINSMNCIFNIYTRECKS